MARTDSVLRQAAEKLVPGSFRHEVLLAARRFKSGWVELAQLLVRVKDEAQYQAWGYPTLEAYCAQELNIRRQTALKLLRSYYFLSRHEPRETLKENFRKRAPAFEIVEVMAKADQQRPISEAEYRQVRDSIWDPDKPMAALRREISERLPQLAPSRRESKTEPRRLAEATKKLVEQLIRSPQLPRAIAQRASALAAEVESWASKADRD
jgi:hypothetical protein